MKNMDNDVPRKAVVLAGAGGLGAAASRALGDAGMQVTVCDGNLARARAVAEEIAASGGEASAQEVQFGDLDGVTRTCDQILERVGTVDILVNITGGPRTSDVTGLSRDEWRQYFDAMFLSVVTATESFLPEMRKQGWGRIITSTSSGVVTPIKGLIASNALRAALVAWSKTLSNDIAADGVTANVVAPGRIATRRVVQLDETRAEARGLDPDVVARESQGSIPTGRYGTPEEFASLVSFLASDSASYVNGSVMRVDGGMMPSIF